MGRPKKAAQRKKRTTLADSWVKRQKFLAPKKLHALGVISVFWNACETHLLVLFMMVARLPPHTAWIIAHDLGDTSLSERIREIAKSRSEDGLLASEIVDSINNILKVHDICRQNRNSLTHFKMEFKGNDEGRLIRMKGPSMIRHPLPDDLEQFRRIADEIEALAAGLHTLWQNIDRRNKGIVEPLPKKLPLPNLLWKPGG